MRPLAVELLVLDDGRELGLALPGDVGPPVRLGVVGVVQAVDEPLYEVALCSRI